MNSVLTSHKQLAAIQQPLMIVISLILLLPFVYAAAVASGKSIPVEDVAPALATPTLRAATKAFAALVPRFSQMNPEDFPEDGPYLTRNVWMAILVTLGV